MNIQVSVGEAIDKYSILELKVQKIKDNNKLTEVKKELEILKECRTYINKYQLYYNILKYINEEIWDETDKIKLLKSSDSNYAAVAEYIFNLNQKRFRVKSLFNSLTQSNIKEQKSYSQNHAVIKIPDRETFYEKLTSINYLLFEYDTVSFDCNFMDDVTKIYNLPCVVNNTITATTNIIDLSTFTKTIKLYDFPIIRYISGGLFGDFIHQLSVINEKFLNTGSKGVLYIANIGDNFRLGVDVAFNDSYELVTAQPYISSYKLYTGEPFDINLSVWRTHPNFWNNNLYGLFSSTYNVEWATHKWLHVPYDEKWKGTVLINTTPTRFPAYVDVNSILGKFDNIVFICQDISEYEHFKARTKLEIPVHKVETLLEMVTAINSCKLFIGTLTASLTYAHGCLVDRIALYDTSSREFFMIKNMSERWLNFYINDAYEKKK
jgi:hypothetical protein